MASNPGPFTDWPWKNLGNYKYIVLAPWAAASALHVSNWWRRQYGGGGDATGDGTEERLNLLLLTIIPIQIARVLHSLLWISWARLETASSKHRILHKGIEFEQVDRERNWDDQIILTTIFLYALLPISRFVPWWDARGIVITALVHAGPVEFVYYWLHRALHHHVLYSRYHSHHHSSIVTEPITAVIHPFAEEVAYVLLFASVMIVTAITGTISIASVGGYLFYVDFMNFLGHCNLEVVPRWFFSVFPPLKLLMYTPSFHSLHHTRFRTNYSLFMPLYDHLYGTADPLSDDLYDRALRGDAAATEGGGGAGVAKLRAVHLTHATGLASLWHLRPGIASLASRPYEPTGWQATLLALPAAFFAPILPWFCRSAVAMERNRVDGVEVQTWAVPRCNFHYSLPWEKQAITGLIDRAIAEAEAMGAKVVSLGLLNQSEELNGNGDLYVRRNPKLGIRTTDGTSLAAAVILDSIPQGTKQVIVRGRVNKVASAVVRALCQRGVQVVAIKRSEFEALKLQLPASETGNCNGLAFSNSFAATVWLVGDGLSREDQHSATKGTRFIPFSHFLPKAARKDCVYHTTPAMSVPKSLENMHSCENWLPRRVMSAWRIAGIVHALEGWSTHEVGDSVLDCDQVWQAALKHGFLPLPPPPL